MLLDDSSGATIELTCGCETPRAPTDGVEALPVNGARAADTKPVTKETKQIGLTVTGRTIDLSMVNVGAVVKVKGGIGVFRGEKQVILERICMYRSINLGLSTFPFPSNSLMFYQCSIVTATNLPYLSSYPHHQRRNNGMGRNNRFPPRYP